MSNRIPIIAGNWKMNLDYTKSIDLIQKLIWSLQDAKHDFDETEVVVVPSYTSIRSVQTVVDSEKTGVKYGAQDLSIHDDGAFTGEVSSTMLSALGCSYVVVGHSERRQYHAETDELVAQKAVKAQSAGITPIVCVGEPLEVRQESKHVEYNVKQVEGSLENVDPKNLVIAYEPVWAIGTGEVATPEDAQEVCAAIRSKLSDMFGQNTAEQIRIQYGGSVKSSSIKELMEKPDVDGALVGGAALDPDEFSRICRFKQIG
jgi:triosephosphate isomerase